MSRKAKENKEHFTSRENETEHKPKKRPSKQRGTFGENNGTVQHRTINPLKGKK